MCRNDQTWISAVVQSDTARRLSHHAYGETSKQSMEALK